MRNFCFVLTMGAVLHGVQSAAQTHKVAKPEQVVRAVGVYEWTGDLKKPEASRLIPVTLFIDGSLVDAGVYLPRPIPFALTPGNEYELQKAGVGRGVLELASARHLQAQADDAGFEDGWFGYGSYKAAQAAKKEPALRVSRTPAVLTSSKDPLGSGSEGKGAGKPEAGASADADRPTMRRRGDPSAPAATPDPGSSAGSPTPADDPDRPTLRRRSGSAAEDAKTVNKGKQAGEDVASVTARTSLNNDPDRPNLHRGARARSNESTSPQLTGVPKELHQMVAVSDASNRPLHDFDRPWQDEKEKAVVLGTMQSMARARLAAYEAANGLGAGGMGTAGTVGPVSRRSATAGRSRGKGRAAVRAKPAAARDVPLADEELKAYTLSYGGAATYVYTAHTNGAGAEVRYVTVVAQADGNGDLRSAIDSVTDEAHFDRTPRLRFVDVVDAEASNRASLLFEVRGKSTRQFALYRVVGSRAEAIFTTGTTP